MTWERISPRTGARSAMGGISCAWRARERRMAITLGADICRKLQAQPGDKTQRITAEIDPAAGKIRLTLERGGDWGLRWKDGCAAVHIPLDHLVVMPTQQPARPADYDLVATAKQVVVTLPEWAKPRAAVVPMPKPAPTPQRANKLPREPELSPREQDEREIEGLIRANRERWTGRVIAEEYGWPIQEAAAFVTRMRAKIDAEMAGQAAE